MKKLILSMVVASILVTSPVMAKGVYFVDGNKLFRNCQNVILLLKDKDHDRSAADQCIGYISGVNDLDVSFDLEKISKLPYCKPPSADMEQMIRVIVLYMKNHPEQLHYPGSALVEVALSKAFPCR